MRGNFYFTYKQVSRNSGILQQPQNHASHATSMNKSIKLIIYSEPGTVLDNDDP